MDDRDIRDNKLDVQIRETRSINLHVDLYIGF